MKNRMKGLRRGFTLLETVITVGIVVALLAISGIGVASYMRSMKQLELDGIAKEIFLAAQNNLSVAYAQNYAGLVTENEKSGNGESNLLKVDSTTWEEDPNDIYFFVVGSSYSVLDDTLLGQLLPYGSVDETVRKGGSYIIRYQKSSGLVLDVFYAENSGKYAHTLTDADCKAFYEEYRTGAWTELSENAKTKSWRRDYSNEATGAKRAVIGYYGPGAPEEKTENDLKAPIVTVFNGERLYAMVDTNNSNTDELTLILYVEGEQSGARKEFPLDATGNAEIATRDLILFDDITSAAEHFKNVFGTEYIPGENLLIRAAVYNNNKGIMAESPIIKTNSLFASYDPASGTAEISAIRHLENLDTGISGRSHSTLPGFTTAKQTTDLAWSAFFGNGRNGQKGGTICDPAGTARAAEGKYAPVNIESDDKIIYDGGFHKIQDIDTGAWTGPVGIFGELGDCTVGNLKVVNAMVSGTASGALCGYADGCTFTGVLAYNDAYPDTAYEISGSVYAGGLIGYMEDSKVDGCAAAVYVRADGTDNNGTAGGFVGSVTDSVITNSYAGGHTAGAVYDEGIAKDVAGHINVIGGTYAGGFAGSAAVTRFAYTYSTCSVTGKNAAGFLAQSGSGNQIHRSYNTGLVVKSSAGDAQTDVFFLGTQPTFTGISYFMNNISKITFRDNIKDDDENTVLCGVSGKDTTATEYILKEEDRQQAYVYDPALRVEYLGKFYFPTVDQLHIFDKDVDYDGIPGITDTHFGDW